MYYTGKGDRGKTTLYNDSAVYSKSNLIFEALGSLDELNTWLGIVKTDFSENDFILKKTNTFIKIIASVQNNLFSIQAEVGGADEHITGSETVLLEEIIRNIEKQVSTLKHFVVPGTTRSSAILDYARALARRSERCVVRVHEEDKNRVHKNTLVYLNRLSSFLFALARYVEHKEGASPEAPTY